MIVPVVLAGGAGARLWPLSRKDRPKQFLKLFRNTSLFQQALKRLDGISQLANPLVICNESHRFIVAEQLREIGLEPASILLEPLVRSTALALAVGALKADEAGGDPVLLVLAADHLVRDIDVFHRAVEQAVRTAQDDKLVTFGVPPDGPETGYGYIRVQGATPGRNCYQVDRFIEKPDRRAAERYIAEGNVYWNSGMFVFRASVFLKELETHHPAALTAARVALGGATADPDFLRLDRDAYSSAPTISVDHAVMEKSRRVLCVPLDAGWSDVGSWQSVWALAEKDERGNGFFGDTIDVGSRNSLMISEDKLLATVGVDNLLVISTPDAVLVADKRDAQQIKRIIDRLESLDRYEHRRHRTVWRSWGSFDVIECGDGCQLNRVQLKPGANLSLQERRCRSENWVVVKGTAEVKVGDEVTRLSESQSVAIPPGARFRLSNPGKGALEVIVVRTGSCPGKDDIQDFEASG